MKRILTAALLALGAALPAAADERVEMPLGAFMCLDIAPAVEHARIVRQPSSAGLSEHVEAMTGAGLCRIIKEPATVTVVDVDKRGFALVSEEGRDGRWWTDAENIWGYFDAPAKIQSWGGR